MPNHKSAAKRARQTETRTARNRLVKASMRTTIKKARAPEAGDEALTAAVKDVYKAASKGVIHKRQAARRVSRLVKAHNSKKAAA
ncbi:MAG: 30S ribosomal protein S20 [Chrysiogenetes bacterium]|nr:30S ribosomal protein S20 [Chrysiogenetes bacterium]